MRQRGEGAGGWGDEGELGDAGLEARLQALRGGAGGGEAGAANGGAAFPPAGGELEVDPDTDAQRDSAAQGAGAEAGAGPAAAVGPT